MQRIEISGVKFDCFNKWELITLPRFVSLCKVEVPEKLTVLWKAKNESEEWNKAIEAINETDISQNFLKYYKDVILCLTDITAGILDMVSEEQVNEIYYKLLHPVALSAVLNTPFENKEGVLSLYEPKQTESFKLLGEEYFYPNEVTIADTKVPMGSEEIISFVEAGDIVKEWKQMAEIGHKNIALLAGIYCRKKGEPYKQETAIERAKLFENLTMDIYWTVFFCTLEPIMKSRSVTRSYMVQSGMKRKGHHRWQVN